MDLQRMSEKAGHPQPSLTALLLVSSPLPRHATFLQFPRGSLLEELHIIHKDSDTTAYVLSFPQRSKGNIKKEKKNKTKPVTGRWTGSHCFSMTAYLRVGGE